VRLPRLVVADGSVEALKWLALLLMTGDHVNKYLFNGTVPLLFNAGRLALPIFCFVLAYNLARPDTLRRGVYRRTLKRLALFGLAATPAFLALGGLWAGWWPLNVMFTLLAATAVLFLIDQGGRPRLVVAAAVFLVAGSSVEYWWPALSICLAVWWYCRKPSVPALALLLASCAALWFINGNFWALAALPVVAAAAHVDVRLPRLRWAFYAYYPLHLVALWLIRIPMSKAGYLFF
jgi:hypothetical protein